MQIIDRIKSFSFDEQSLQNEELGRLEFIKKFPIESIKNLSIDEFVIGTDKNSFCYWLEFKNILFGIGGGNASKFGLFKSKNDNSYFNKSGKNKIKLEGKELQEYFESIKITIIEALKYAENNEIQKIVEIKTPIWNIVLLKILCLYFPEKFITIGAFEVLKKCAEELKIENIQLTTENLIQINYEIKKKINSLDEFKDWSYNKIGNHLWSIFGNDQKISAINNIEIKEQVMNIPNFPLNTILYGPPGTGKTYNTIIQAAKIISENDNLTFEEAQRILNENLGDRIEFITFHQNFSYEDFIQGIRPDISEESNLKFKKIDGIFKRIADRALENYNLSLKSSKEVSDILTFKEALEQFKNDINESENQYKINETVHILRVEDDAFRYSADSWKEFNGFRMKFSDLIEFNENNISSRQDIKKLNNISGLAKQHASYYFKTYEIIKNLKTPVEQSTKVSLQNYVIIIDEINRANISRVFGELITLIEEDKRSHGKIPLSAILPSGDKFVVPSNLYIIGTMNTADKSIALLDIALRRRFEFKAFYPDYTLDGINDLEILKNLNAKIIEKKSHDFQIGHSFFMDEKYDLISTMNNKVIPLISEYFMNDKNDILEILNSVDLRGKDLRIVDNSWPIKLEKIN